MPTDLRLATLQPLAPTVIPAQAGIQWFRQDISACRQAEMTTQCVVIAARAGKSRNSSKHPGSALLGDLFQTCLRQASRNDD